MSFRHSKVLLLAVALIVSIVFNTSAYATYYSGWNKSYYSVSSYHKNYQYSYKHCNSGYGGYHSNYKRSKYYKHTKYSSHKKYKRSKHGWKKKHHKPKDNKPVAKNDEYSIKKGDNLVQNVIDENDIQGDGVGTADIVYGSLPSGVTLSEDGSLIGSTQELGTFAAYYKLRDEDGDYSKAKITINVSEDIAYCPQPAESDELHNGNSIHAIWIPLISKKLKFIDEPTSTRTLPSGDLVVTGIVADEDHEFSLSLIFSDFQDESDAPKLELKDSAYLANGGVIDPSTWDFYGHLEGSLTGTKGIWTGTTLTSTIRGPKGQIGFGASGKNQNFGFSSWFDLTIDSTSNTLPEGYHLGQQLYGDINIDLLNECPVIRDVVSTQCSLAAEVDSYAKYSGGHAVTLFNFFSEDFTFEPAAQVLNYNTGDIEISGIALDTAGQGFDVSFTYSASTDEGSPKLELIDSAYSDMSGPIDPTTWRYLDEFNGSMVGRAGDFAGVEIELTPRGPVTQVGNGANGKNVNYGLSNWLTATVTQGTFQSGIATGSTYNGDINIDIKDDCSVDVDNPVDAVDNSYVLKPNELLDVNIFDNDLLGDPETSLSFNSFSLPFGFTLMPNGQLTGSSTAINVVFQFDYTITDADGDTDTATVTIELQGLGDA